MNNKAIFKQGSKTFYTASLFFPEDVRKDVSTLYAYVRTADDFVDQIPQDKKSFSQFLKQSQRAFQKGHSGNIIIDDFVELCHTHAISKEWVDAFLQAMEQDLTTKKYETYKELEHYMFGSAEVIGLMMARILHLTRRANHTARLQGKAMQLINFIRDIQEDLELGRQYLPQEDLEKFGISKLSEDIDQIQFTNLVRFEIQRYHTLQKKAEEGYRYLPLRARFPIAAAAALYKWTASEISKDPMTVFQKKIKPSRSRIILEVSKQYLGL